MGLSTGRDLHIDQNLTNLAINYRPEGMIGDMIAPTINVMKEHDIFPVFNRGEAFSIENTLRSRGTAANKITRSVSSNGYHVRNFALAYEIPIEDYANMDAAYEFELGAGASQHLLDKLALDADRRILTLAGAAASVSTTFVPASSWLAGGDPYSQLMTAMEQAQSKTAQKLNSVLFGWKAWNYFRRNQNMRNFISGANNAKGAITREAARGALEVERFLVAEAFYNSANEAQAESLASTFAADDVILYFAPTAPARDKPSWMYNFRWTNPALGTPMAVERHPYDGKLKVQRIEAGYYQDEKVVGSDYAVKISGVGSSQANGIA